MLLYDEDLFTASGVHVVEREPGHGVLSHETRHRPGALRREGRHHAHGQRGQHERRTRAQLVAFRPLERGNIIVSRY